MKTKHIPTYFTVMVDGFLNCQVGSFSLDYASEILPQVVGNKRITGIEFIYESEENETNESVKEEAIKRGFSEEDADMVSTSPTDIVKKLYFIGKLANREEIQKITGQSIPEDLKDCSVFAISPFNKDSQMYQIYPILGPKTVISVKDEDELWAKYEEETGQKRPLNLAGGENEK